MEYRRMRRTGLKVSEICLGAMTFGPTVDEAGARELVALALSAGVNFFDVADAYGGGRSEEPLGRALGPRRRDVVLATKFEEPMGAGPNDSGTSRAHIMQAIEDSLRRLGTDHVDLYYVHHVDTQSTVEEMLSALDDLVIEQRALFGSGPGPRSVQRPPTHGSHVRRSRRWRSVAGWQG